MIVLTLRTDKPEAEIGLCKDGKQLAYITWQAHRHLAETIHQKINELLEQTDSSLSDLSGVIVYAGPGSFTGLRIGMSVANALAYSTASRVVASGGETWIEDGTTALSKAQAGVWAVPVYGGSANITKPKK